MTVLRIYQWINEGLQGFAQEGSIRRPHARNKTDLELHGFIMFIAAWE